MDLLSAFLSAALEADWRAGWSGRWLRANDDLTSAKEPEFPLVFLCGMEEGFISTSNVSRMTRISLEERRLCYVGITRAEKTVFFYAEQRQLYGQTV